MAASKFQRIALLARHHHAGVKDTLMTLHSFLSQNGYEANFEAETCELLSLSTSKHNIHKNDLHQRCDLMIVVGGDGSLLHAARIAAQQDLPVLGINRGRLGFLTDIYPDELSKINDILLGQYREEKRFLLTVQLCAHQQILNESDVLNDVVLLPGKIVHMIEFDIYINQQFMCNQRADGLIVATPTGSTAYALSANGPILHPQLDAVVLVPMFPHTLTSRPIVVHSDSTIQINLSSTNDISAITSWDGQERLEVKPGYSLLIRKKPQALRLIHPLDYNYYETLRTKLQWHSQR